MNKEEIVLLSATTSDSSYMNFIVSEPKHTEPRLDNFTILGNWAMAILFTVFIGGFIQVTFLEKWSEGYKMIGMLLFFFLSLILITKIALIYS